MLLDGKRIILTGGASGIGACTVRLFVEHGASVVALDVSDEAGESVVAEATSMGPGKATYAHCDVSDQSRVNEVFRRSIEGLGGLDVLAMIAGQHRPGAAEDLTDTEIDAMLSINLKGTMFTNAAAFRAMRESGGSIINYASHAGLEGHPGSAAYSASKGAVIAYSRTIARDWGPHGVRVNVVCPGARTPMFDEHLAGLSDDERARVREVHRQSIPLGGELGPPEDVASVNVFLASELSRRMTGQTIVVDGGRVMVR